MFVQSNSNRRSKQRPPSQYLNPKDFADNTLGSVAYIHPENADAGVGSPKIGLVNEYSEEGCSIVLTGECVDDLHHGDHCYLRLEPGRGGRAVVRWRVAFGLNAAKVGFQFVC